MKELNGIIKFTGCFQEEEEDKEQHFWIRFFI
jgi:hypothetical protein